MFKEVKEVSVAQAMEQRTYLFELMRITKLTSVCAELRRNYDPRSPTTYDDRAVYTQLDTDLSVLQMRFKFWEQNQEVFIAMPHQNLSHQKKNQQN